MFWVTYPFNSGESNLLLNANILQSLYNMPNIGWKFLVIQKDFD